MLARYQLKYFLFAEVNGFRRLRLDFLTGIVLRVPTMDDRVFDFPRKRRGKRFPEAYSPLPQTRLTYFCYALKKYLFRLDRADHRGVTFLGIFTCGFDDHMDVLPSMSTYALSANHVLMFLSHVFVCSFRQSFLKSSSPIIITR